MTMTTTTATTTMMATIDISCNNGEMGAAAASEDDVGMASTQAQTGSSFTLGDRQDRVLTIDAINVKITSTSVPEKHVTLTTKRCACFKSIREVDIEVREVNCQTRAVAYRTHIGELYYVSVTSGYGSVDIRRFYVPYGLASENVHPTCNGIGLHLDEWAHLLELLPTIHEQHLEMNVNAESSDEEIDKKQ